MTNTTNTESAEIINVTHVFVTERGWDCAIADRGDGSYVPEVVADGEHHTGAVCSSEAEARRQLEQLVRDLEREADGLDAAEAMGD